MKQTIWIIMAVVSVVLFISKFTRLGNGINSLQWRSGKEDYLNACQQLLDSAAIVFTPLATSMANNELVDDSTLAKATLNLYDLSSKANRIDAFNDEKGYYKKYVAEFIELERGLTCCYLQKYQVEIKMKGGAKKGTIANLQSWIAQFNGWRHLYYDENFNYHNQLDFSTFQEKLNNFSMK